MTSTMMTSYEDDNTTTITMPTKTMTHPYSPTLNLPHNPYGSTICTPWLKASFTLVFQAANCLEDEITNMSTAIDKLSASIANMPHKTIHFESPTPQNQIIPSPMEPPHPASQPHPFGSSFPSLRHHILLPLPTTHPPFTRKYLANMRPQTHVSPCFQAQLLQIAKHNYRLP